MLNIGLHIRQLLLSHQEVGLSGIGLFSKKRIAARYDREGQFFFPPSFTISLFPGNIEKDEHLLTALCQTYGIKPAEAQAEIDHITTRILEEIETKGSVYINSLGTLQQSQGQLTFTSDNMNWAFQTVKEPITQEEILHIPETLAITPLTDTIDSEDHISSEEEVVVNLQQEEQLPAKRKIGWILIGIAAILAFIVAAFLTWNQYQKKTHHLSGATAQTNLPDKEPMTAAIPSPGKDTATITDSIPKTVKDTVPLVQKASDIKQYTIVIGSFKNMELAIKQAEYWRSIGIPAYVQESRMPQNRKKICYGSYPTKEAAAKDLPKIQQEVNKEAYIFP